MKKLLFIFLLLSAFASQGQVKVLGYVVPNSPTDAYPTHLDIYGSGGYRTVTSLVDRNAITPLRRKAGMLVYVIDSSKIYQLGNDLVTWSSLTVGSGSGGSNGGNEVDPIFTNHIAYTITQAKIDLWNQIARLPLYSTTDSMRKEIRDSVRAHDYNFDPAWFTVTNRDVTFNGSFAYQERDSIFLASVAASITQEDIDRWNANVDLSNYYTKAETDQNIHDSLFKYIYYFDGVTIKGTGRIDNPFHVIPFGDTAFYRTLDIYTREQVDSAIAANFREYSAGYGLVLENQTFRLDTALLGHNGGFGGGSDTAIQDIIGLNSNTLRVFKKTGYYDIIFGNGGNTDTTGGNTGGNTGGGSGTVTNVSVVNTFGLTGTVANPTTTPSITMTIDSTKYSTVNNVNTSIKNVVNNFGDSLANVRNTFTNTVSKILPYNGDSNYYIGGDDTLHHMPITLPPNDSIDYSFSSMTTIYNEKGPGEAILAGHGITINGDNLNFPFRQLKSLDIGGWNATNYVSFSYATVKNSTAYTFLRGFVRLKQAVPIIQSLSFQFYNNGTPVSQILSMVNYGLDKSKVNVYQNITIPMSAFAFTSNSFDEIRLIFGGGSSSSGLYLDLFQFQNATAQENTYITDVFRLPGSTQVYKVLGGQNVPAYIDSVGVGSTSTSIDTASLSSRINQKLNIVDTANMRLRPVAGSGMSITGTYPNLTFTSATTDTSSLSSRINQKLNIVDTIGLRLRAIAGTNMTITGTYPNLTFNSAGTSVVTDDATISATASQTAFTFTSVPSNYNDYWISRNGVLLQPTVDYTTSGNTITIISFAADAADKIRYHRTK